MPLTVNLRHLVDRDLSLKGELPVSELDIETGDDMVQLKDPMKYDLEVQQLEQSLLIRGKLELKLDCTCVRCLKPFQTFLKLPDWVCDVPLEGEEKAPIVSDSVDLTPYAREDILLTLPQHPLCKPDCGGLKKTSKTDKNTAGPAEIEPSIWADLDKLKL